MMRWDVSIVEVDSFDELKGEPEEFKGVQVHLDPGQPKITLLDPKGKRKPLRAMDPLSGTVGIRLDGTTTLTAVVQPDHYNFDRLFPQRFKWEIRPHKLEQIARALFDLEPV